MVLSESSPPGHGPGAAAAGLQRVRELTRAGGHAQALALAETLAAGAPEDRELLYAIAANLRCLGRVDAALATLQRLEALHPGYGRLFQERGHCHAARRDLPLAIAAFERAVELNPYLPASWAMLERLRPVAGDAAGAAHAGAQVAALRTLPEAVVRAGSLHADGDHADAEALLAGLAGAEAAHPEVQRLMARIDCAFGEPDEARRRLEALLAREPDQYAARLDLARVLVELQMAGAARAQARVLLQADPASRDACLLEAIAAAALGDHAGAIAGFTALLKQAPAAPQLHVLLGHVHQAAGERDAAIAAFRAALAVAPGFGDACWSLANLKTFRFTADEVARMRALEADPATPAADRWHLCFALGKAHEDEAAVDDAWHYYARGNALKRAASRYRPEFVEIAARRQAAVCTPAFFAARAGWGVPDPDPIFVVGLPRSGSTLVEQILASHPRVDGTQELFEIQRYANELGGRRPDPLEPRYPDALAQLTPPECAALGRRYLDDTRAYRGGRPRFVDKMPNNFRHVGLIHLMLPNARIIDVRREPMACCFSNLKQLFAGGQDFAYGIDEIARYYRSYLELMRHWDAALPGRVLRVHYEDLVEDLEGGVRRILAHCALAFEPACLAFHRTERSVRTPSAEQVRRPIYRDALEPWRPYERWLQPLAEALGEARHAYRNPGRVD